MDVLNALKRPALIVLLLGSWALVGSGCDDSGDSTGGTDAAEDIRVRPDIDMDLNRDDPDVDSGDLDPADSGDLDPADTTDDVDPDAPSDSGDVPPDESAEAGDLEEEPVHPVTCSELEECNFGEHAWCQGDSYVSCGSPEDACETIVSPCGLGFTCGSALTRCLDGHTGGDSCDDAIVLSPGFYSLTNVSYGNDYEEYRGNCDFHMNIWGPDRVFALTPPDGTTWTVSVEGLADVDVVLAVVSNCDNIVNSCEQYADVGQEGVAESVELVGDNVGTTWYVIVDGWGTWDFGRFTITILE